MSGDQWLFLGGISAAIAWVLFAVIFAPLAMYGGWMVARKGTTWFHDETSRFIGLLLGIVGAVEFMLWFSFMNSLYAA